MLVALAAAISISALLRPLLWSESDVAHARERFVQPMAHEPGTEPCAPQVNASAVNASAVIAPAAIEPAAIEPATIESASPRETERATATDAGRRVEARVKRNVAPNRERPGQGHVPPRDA
ncbi:MAG: hypothetical protein JNM84_01675 [Planctomycetes bacterium]|nr:hypothetical protein [Planctomycetota bacterium]